EYDLFIKEGMFNIRYSNRFWNSIWTDMDKIEKFYNILFASSQQHVEMRSSLVNRDTEDIGKLMTWFFEHHSFPKIKQIISISIGVIGNENNQLLYV
ncbi:hypothetical protein ALC62_06276, partial [Cyphomyrmex costatus]